jgi:hypothetical protein
VNKRQLIALLKDLPDNVEVEVNDNRGGEVYAIEDVTLYTPNLDLWPDDKPAIILQVNCDA